MRANLALQTAFYTWRKARWEKPYGSQPSANTSPNKLLCSWGGNSAGLAERTYMPIARLAGAAAQYYTTRRGRHRSGHFRQMIFSINFIVHTPSKHHKSTRRPTLQRPLSSPLLSSPSSHGHCKEREIKGVRLSMLEAKSLTRFSSPPPAKKHWHIIAEILRSSKNFPSIHAQKKQRKQALPNRSILSNKRE